MIKGDGFENHRLFCKFDLSNYHLQVSMIQINKQNCTKIGYIQKIHGIKGEVIAFIEEEFLEAIESSEFLFIDLDGGLVPFFINEESFRFKSNETVILGFEFINSALKAQELVGHQLYMGNNELSEAEHSEQYDRLTGMHVVDQNRGDIGKINRIDDFAGNMVISVKNPHGEILIPFNDKIISKIDEKNRIIFLECPEGLIDLYLE